jgi:hypothetical protein
VTTKKHRMRRRKCHCGKKFITPDARRKACYVCRPTNVRAKPGGGGKESRKCECSTKREYVTAHTLQGCSPDKFGRLVDQILAGKRALTRAKQKRT